MATGRDGGQHGTGAAGWKQCWASFICCLRGARKGLLRKDHISASRPAGLSVSDHWQSVPELETRVRPTSDPSHEVPLRFYLRQKTNRFPPERSKMTTMLRCEQQNCKQELPGGRGCLNQQVTAARRARQDRRWGARGVKESLPTPAGPAEGQGRGRFCLSVPGPSALPGAAERSRTGGSPTGPTRPTEHGSTAQEPRAGGTCRATAMLARAAGLPHQSPLRSAFSCLSTSQQGHESNVAPGSRESSIPESSAGSQSPARVPQLQLPSASVWDRVSQMAAVTEQSLLYSRTKCPPCQYIKEISIR